VKSDESGHPTGALDEDAEWAEYLAEFHDQRPGAVEAVLSQAAAAGDTTPYRWLARAIPPRVRTVLDLACGSGAVSRELAAPDRTLIGIDLSQAELALGAGQDELSPQRQVPGGAADRRLDGAGLDDAPQVAIGERRAVGVHRKAHARRLRAPSLPSFLLVFLSHHFPE